VNPIPGLQLRAGDVGLIGEPAQLDAAEKLIQARGSSGAGMS
jgi:hypothetical protein